MPPCCFRLEAALRRLAALALLLSASIVSACDTQPLQEFGGRILLPLRVCAVEGNPLTIQGGTPSMMGNDALDSAVSQAISDVDTKVWIPGANIAFYQTIPAGNYNTLVIADPQPPSNSPDGITTGPGQLGDIYVGSPGIQLATTEMDQAYQSCLNAWSAGNDAGKTGIIVILARFLVDQVGVESLSIGVNPGHASTVLRNNGDDLCVVPRHLIPDDVAHQYVIVADSLQSNVPFYNTLAHELGHTLLLSHGDGLNNGGTLPPNPGRRRFDTDCWGTNVGHSLMSPAGGDDTITPLQRELARDAAVLVSGHSIL